MKWSLTAFSSGWRILVPSLARTSTKSIQFLKPRIVRKSLSPPFNLMEGVPSEKFFKNGEKDLSREGQEIGLAVVGSVTVSLGSEGASCGVNNGINNRDRNVLSINKATGAFILMEYIKRDFSYSQRKGRTRTILVTSIETAASSLILRIKMSRNRTLEELSIARVSRLTLLL